MLKKLNDERTWLLTFNRSSLLRATEKRKWSSVNIYRNMTISFRPFWGKVLGNKSRGQARVSYHKINETAIRVSYTILRGPQRSGRCGARMCVSKCFRTHITVQQISTKLKDIFIIALLQQTIAKLKKHTIKQKVHTWRMQGYHYQ